MKIEVGSTWVNKNDLDNTVTVDTVGAFAVTGHSDKDGLYMANIDDFLHYFEPMPDTSYGSLRELSEQEFENIIDEAFDEGYEQAIDDLIEAGIIEEGEYSDERYLDEEYPDEEYSEYEFGDVEDDEDGEEEYCFSKELEKILNGAFVVGTNSNDVERKHSHYFKDVRHLDYVDIYQVCKLFPVDDDSGAITHATKKLLVAGGRGAGKDMIKDITEARDTLNRYLQIEGVDE